MSDTITAREFVMNTFNTDFLQSEELETIISAMQLFAKGKCKEQREICFNAWKGMPEWVTDLPTDRTKRAEKTILNAKEPEF